MQHEIRIDLASVAPRFFVQRSAICLDALAVLRVYPGTARATSGRFLERVFRARVKSAGRSNLGARTILDARVAPTRLMRDDRENGKLALAVGYPSREVRRCVTIAFITSNRGLQKLEISLPRGDFGTGTRGFAASERRDLSRSVSCRAPSCPLTMRLPARRLGC